MKAMMWIHPKVHVFGHIHSSHGTLDWEGTRFINASQIDEKYRMVYQPIVIDI
jgi:Icc-related predicted phosphoesterase